MVVKMLDYLLDIIKSIVSMMSDWWIVDGTVTLLGLVVAILVMSIIIRSFLR